MGQLKARRRQRAKDLRKNGKRELPRQCCRVCGKLFDYAVIKVDTPVSGTICSGCKQLLAQGFVAVVSMKGYAFVRHPDLKDMAGQIVPMSDENLQQIQAKFDADVKLKEPEQPADPAGN